MQKLSWEMIETNAFNLSKNSKNYNNDEHQKAQKFEIDLMRVFGVGFHEGLHEYQIRDAQGKIGYTFYYVVTYRFLVHQWSDIITVKQKERSC